MTLKDYCFPTFWWELWPYEQIFPFQGERQGGGEICRQPGNSEWCWGTHYGSSQPHLPPKEQDHIQDFPWGWKTLSHIQLITTIKPELCTRLFSPATLLKTNKTKTRYLVKMRRTIRGSSRRGWWPIPQQPKFMYNPCKEWAAIQIQLQGKSPCPLCHTPT